LAENLGQTAEISLQMTPVPSWHLGELRGMGAILFGTSLPALAGVDSPTGPADGLPSPAQE
jgi:hypothetical protein